MVYWVIACVEILKRKFQIPLLEKTYCPSAWSVEADSLHVIALSGSISVFSSQDHTPSCVFYPIIEQGSGKMSDLFHSIWDSSDGNLWSRFFSLGCKRLCQFCLAI